MAASVNRVMLIGYCGKDPESRSQQDGTRVVSFQVATSEHWKDSQSGERKERTQWHRIVVAGNDHLVKIAADRVRKGSHVHVEGKIQTRKWTKDGTDHFITEVLVGRFNAALNVLDGRADDGERRSGDGPAAGPAANAGGTVHRAATTRYNTRIGDEDGRLPEDAVPF